jgi:hypothetical protein
MSQTRRSSSVIMIFMLVSGLIVLWRRGRDDLDAWGQRSPSNSYRIVRPRQASQPGGLTSLCPDGSDPPAATGTPAATSMTLRPEPQKGAATTSLPSGSAAISPAGKS